MSGSIREQRAQRRHLQHGQQRLLARDQVVRQVERRELREGVLRGAGRERLDAVVREGERAQRGAADVVRWD